MGREAGMGLIMQKKGVGPEWMVNNGIAVVMVVGVGGGMSG